MSERDSSDLGGPGGGVPRRDLDAATAAGGGVEARNPLGCPGCASTGCAIFGCLKQWESLVGPVLGDQPAGERWCRRCGCTDLRACVVDGVACHWVDEEAWSAERATGNEQQEAWSGPGLAGAGPSLCSACRDAARDAVDGAWRHYAGLALAAEAPELQRPGCRRAFYAGILAAYRGFRQEAWSGGPSAETGKETAVPDDLASLPMDELEGLAVAAVLALPMVLAPAFAPAALAVDAPQQPTPEGDAP